MNAAQAIARIRKALGKRAEIHDYKKPSSQEQRDTERAAKREAKEARDAAIAARSARQDAILSADPEYCNLRDAAAAASKTYEAMSYGFYYRYKAGTNQSVFFHVDAEADTLAELVEKVEAKKVTQ